MAAPAAPSARRSSSATSPGGMSPGPRHDPRRLRPVRRLVRRQGRDRDRGRERYGPRDFDRLRRGRRARGRRRHRGGRRGRDGGRDQAGRWRGAVRAHRRFAGRGRRGPRRPRGYRLRRPGHRRQRRRDRRRVGVARRHRRGAVRPARRGEPQIHLPVDEVRDRRDARTGRRRDRQHRLDQLLPSAATAGELYRHEVRRRRHHQGRGDRLCPVGNPDQRRRAGCNRHADAAQRHRGARCTGAGRDQSAEPAGPVRHDRRDRPGCALALLGPVHVHGRARARGRRRLSLTVTNTPGVAFTPIRVGTMDPDRRLVVASHSGGGGSLLGPETLFERHCAYWTARLRGGAAWVGGGPTFVANPMIPGFEATGVGSHGPGLFRAANFVERMGRFMARLHEVGGSGSVQFVQQGGMPSAPSPTLSSYADHRIPHPLDRDEIDWLVREYGESAGLAAEGDADALELHANHDDVLQWFLSPLTNQRTDGYGGSAENQRRLLREVVEAMRDRVERPVTIGLRLCMDEMIDGGRTAADCADLLAAFTADGTVDYFSLDVGDNWGRVSYIPPGFYDEAEWAPLCGQIKQSTHLPVVYVGRVTSLATAEAILAAGHADLVGFARALIADPELIAKSAAGHPDRVRPCIALQECIDRRVVENLPFACGVNPRAGRDDEAAPDPTTGTLSVLVVGGGPAGTEFAAQMAEQGHAVQLWERSAGLGGQLAVAALLRMNASYGRWLSWQQARLARVAVDVHLGRAADV